MQKEKTKIFLYKKVFEDLKNKILNQEYSCGDILPSEREIGEIYSVERTTVRKALQLLVEEGVVEKKAGKGTVVIYSNNNFPTTIGKIEKKSIAFLLPQSKDDNNKITQPFYSQLFYSAEKLCQKKGYSLVYSTLHEEDDILEFIENNKYAGIIFVSNISPQHIDKAISKKIPSVVVNGYNNKIPSILADNFLGMYKACKFLVNNGHRKIALITGDKEYITNTERFRGCRTALIESSIPIKKDYILGGNSWEFEEGFRLTKELLTSGKEIPTAIIGFNDRLALGAMQAVQKFGLQVPKDISVIGFDNSEQSLYSSPYLTTTEINIPLMAQATITTLLQLIENYELYPIKILTPVSFIKRSSTN